MLCEAASASGTEQRTKLAAMKDAPTKFVREESASGMVRSSKDAATQAAPTKPRRAVFA